MNLRVSEVVMVRMGCFLMMLMSFGACLNVELGPEHDAMRLGIVGLCDAYCDAVMPCDGGVADAFRDDDDCMHTCEGVSYEIGLISNECDQAHRELIECLGLLTCDEALTFSHTTPGSDVMCSMEEEAVLLCQ